MAVAVTINSRYVHGNKRVRNVTLTFSSNYATGGEAITPSTVGLKKIEFVRFSGVATSTDLATANPVGYDYANNKVLFYEGSAAGTAISEKTNSEAYPTGSNVRAEFIGTGGV
jgi:hypothetical protein